MDLSLDQATEVLTRTPAAIRALLGGLSEPWIRGTEGPETFSAFDVVGHLIDGEETDWIPRARIILAGGPDPRFETYDRFRHLERNRGRPLASLLDEFAALRAANLEQLRSWRLATETLDLPGVHPALGRVTLRAAPFGVGRPRPRARRPGRARHGEAVSGGRRTRGWTSCRS